MCPDLKDESFGLNQFKYHCTHTSLCQFQTPNTDRAHQLVSIVKIVTMNEMFRNSKTISPDSFDKVANVSFDQSRRLSERNVARARLSGAANLNLACSAPCSVQICRHTFELVAA